MSSRPVSHAATRPARHPVRVLWTGLLGLALLAVTATALRAEPLKLGAAVSEAVGVHGMATAARLCGFMTESDLNRVRMRMDRVHAAQLDTDERETYLILRSSDGFRNQVFSKALGTAQTGCTAELRQTWSEVHASLVFADIAAQDNRAGVAPSSTLQ
jgi:hypothetical protein